MWWSKVSQSDVWWTIVIIIVQCALFSRLSCEGACHTMLKKFVDYSSVMDNSEDKAGMCTVFENTLQCDNMVVCMVSSTATTVNLTLWVMMKAWT